MEYNDLNNENLPKTSLTPSEEEIIQKIRSLDIHLALDAVLNELERAENKFPKWPADIVHAGAIVSEESGELIRACLNREYPNGWESDAQLLDECKKEAIQTGAMAFRFLKNFNLYMQP